MARAKKQEFVIMRSSDYNPAPEGMQSLTQKKLKPEQLEEIGRSQKYHFIDSDKVIEYMKSIGWTLINVNYANPWLKDPKLIRHTMKFGKINEVPRVPTSTLQPEILITNSHNGEAAFRIHIGMYNNNHSFMVSDPVLAKYKKIRHLGAGQSFKEIQTYIKFAVDRIPVAYQLFNKLSKIKVTKQQQLEFANKAMVLRMPKLNNGETIDLKTIKAHYDVNELLAKLGDGVINDSLFNVFTRISGNLISGNFKHHGTTGRTARKVEEDRKLIKINTELWHIMESYTFKRTSLI